MVPCVRSSILVLMLGIVGSPNLLGQTSVSGNGGLADSTSAPLPSPADLSGDDAGVGSDSETTRAIGIPSPDAEIVRQEKEAAPPSKALEQEQLSGEIVRSATHDTTKRVWGRPRYALVIGNAGYKVGALRNPINDAKAMDESLTALGFHVTRLENLGHQAMMEAVANFSFELPDESFAFFFFAGHGMQLDKNNYLIPVDANLKSPTDVRFQTMPLDYVLDSLSDSRSVARCVALDCCQDNPFERSLRIHRGKVQRGLAETRGGTRENMVIFHATHEGLTALDGKGSNSPYTKAFVETMSQRPASGLLLRDAVFETGKMIEKATGQRPWLNIDVAMPDVYLLPPISKDSNPQMASVGGPKPKSLANPTYMQSDDLGSIHTPPKSLNSNKSSAPSMTCVDLLRQASVYENNGAYDDALAICGTVLQLERATSFDKRSARLKRASICLTRGRIEDLKMALMDKLACGEKQMRLAVRVKESALKEQSKKLGTIRRNQVASVTQINGDWIWVKAVQGDSSRHGWTKLTSFVEPSKVVIVKPTQATITQSELSKSSGSNGSIVNSTPIPQYDGSQSYPSQASTPGNTSGYPSSAPYQPQPPTSVQSGSISSMQPSSVVPYSPPTSQGLSMGRSATIPQQFPSRTPNYNQQQYQSNQYQQSYQPNQQSNYQPQQTYQPQSNQRSQTQRSGNYQQSTRSNGYSQSNGFSGSNGFSSGSMSQVRNMTLGQSQRLIDQNNAQRWKPGANQDSISRQNQQIRVQRQQRVRDFMGK